MRFRPNLQLSKLGEALSRNDSFAHLVLLLVLMWLIAYTFVDTRVRMLTSDLPAYLFALVGNAAKPLALLTAAFILLTHATIFMLYFNQGVPDKLWHQFVSLLICSLIVFVRWHIHEKQRVKNAEPHRASNTE